MKSIVVKRILVMLMPLLIACISACAQGPDIELKIRKVMDSQQQAWNRGDLDAFMQPYWKSDSLIFVGSKGPIYGWQQTLDNYKRNYDGPAKMGKLNFTLLRIQPLGKKYCQVVGRWQLTRDAGDVGGHFSLIFKEINGQWQIIADHSS